MRFLTASAPAPPHRMARMPIRDALRRFFTAGEPYPAITGAELRSGWNSPAANRMFWTGLIVRLLYLTVAHTYRFRPLQDHFQFGWEMGRIARALATGYGYADPFDGHTGPTAWTPPVYPLLMAAAFKVFGVYSNAAGWVILAVNSVFSAATAPAVYEMARRCYGARPDGRKVALWSGWLWALYPAAMQYAVRWPWEMALTCACFTWALVLGLRLRGVGGVSQAQSTPAWAFWGLLWGLVALLNSSVLLLLPIQAVWILWPLRIRPRARLFPAVARGAVALAVFVACLAPWVARNARVFHAFVPMRANFGAELYMAVLPSHDGFPWGASVPIMAADPELQRYARMGELAYSRSQGERGKAMIQADPGRYVKQVLYRVQFYWAGVPHPYDHGLLDEFLREADYSLLSITGLLGLALSLRRGVPAARLFAAAFFVLPLLYYAITVQARFRHPLEPLITIFSVYLFQSADKARLWTFRRARKGGLPLP